jgi:hypothetical protein
MGVVIEAIEAQKLRLFVAHLADHLDANTLVGAAPPTTTSPLGVGCAAIQVAVMKGKLYCPGVDSSISYFGHCTLLIGLNFPRRDL